MASAEQDRVAKLVSLALASLVTDDKVREFSNGLELECYERGVRETVEWLATRQ